MIDECMTAGYAECFKYCYDLTRVYTRNCIMLQICRHHHVCIATSFLFLHELLLVIKVKLSYGVGNENWGKHYQYAILKSSLFTLQAMAK